MNRVTIEITFADRKTVSLAIAQLAFDGRRLRPARRPALGARRAVRQSDRKLTTRCSIQLVPASLTLLLPAADQDAQRRVHERDDGDAEHGNQQVLLDAHGHLPPRRGSFPLIGVAFGVVSLESRSRSWDVIDFHQGVAQVQLDPALLTLLLTPPNNELTEVPRSVTAAMQITAIRATISPYSTIVAPSSSCTNRSHRFQNRFTSVSSRFGVQRRRGGTRSAPGPAGQLNWCRRC